MLPLTLHDSNRAQCNTTTIDSAGGFVG